MALRRTRGREGGGAVIRLQAEQTHRNRGPGIVASETIRFRLSPLAVTPREYREPPVRKASEGKSRKWRASHGKKNHPLCVYMCVCSPSHGSLPFTLLLFSLPPGAQRSPLPIRGETDSSLPRMGNLCESNRA